MNTYLYAPKDDPYHRECWRLPYPPREWSELCQLIDVAVSTGIDFVYGFHPAKGLHFCTEDGVHILLEKAARLYDQGVRKFAILFDDIPSSLEFDEDVRAFGGSLAKAEALWVAAVLQRQPAYWDVEWWFCPSRYSDDPLLSRTFGEFEARFLETVAEHLPPEVSCFWTGPKVVSPEITLSHIAEVAEKLRHPLIVWDNYPVNDLSMREEMHLGPLKGRDRRLPDVAAGHLSNPLLQQELSFIPLATCLDYARHPAGYDPETSWTEAVRDRFGPSGVPHWRAFRRFCEMDAARDPHAVFRLEHELRMELEAALAYASRHSTEAWVTELAPWLERMQHALQ